ncbi:MAG: hypothetical protein GF364_19875 [Candidatus Lokiarchaeota archaeon]|nr:hypothetical protein [Candidatus Lokiarchaeota archaeon]
MMNFENNINLETLEKMSKATHIILDSKIRYSPKITNDYFFLYQFFVEQFKFNPHSLYDDDNGVILILPKNKYIALSDKFRVKKELIQKGIRKKIFYYPVVDTLRELISYLFWHIRIINIVLNLTSRKDGGKLKSSPLIEIYIYIHESQMKYALGKNGNYIHMVNAFLEDCIGSYRIYLRGTYDKNYILEI